MKSLTHSRTAKTTPKILEP